GKLATQLASSFYRFSDRKPVTSLRSCHPERSVMGKRSFQLAHRARGICSAAASGPATMLISASSNTRPANIDHRELAASLRACHSERSKGGAGPFMPADGRGGAEPALSEVNGPFRPAGGSPGMSGVPEKPAFGFLGWIYAGERGFQASRK